MANTKDKVSDAASNVKPYVERAVSDPELRENVKAAFQSAREIYDELIEEVEGYSVDAIPLAGIEHIVREMDAAHKAEAALALFSQGEFVSVQ